jgi:hypothetical protein
MILKYIVSKYEDGVRKPIEIKEEIGKREQ